MKNKLLCIAIAFLLLFSFFSCTYNESGSQTNLQNNIPSTIDSYWNLACENTNAVFYKNLSVMRGLEFELISSFPIESDEPVIEIEFSGSNVLYKTSCEQYVQDQEENFPFYIYQCYQGMDWKSLGELEKKGGEDFRKMQDMYLDDYISALEQGKLPKLYTYMVGINFDIDGISSVTRVSAINVTLRGETKRYALDNFVLDAEKEFEFDNLALSNSIAVSDAPINISNDGTLDLTTYDLQANEVISLTGISLFEEESVAITDCSVILTHTDGTETEMKWDCKTPIQILAGESVSIHTFCNDPSLAGVMQGVTTKYIMVKYMTPDGKEYTEFMQGIYRMRQGLYDLYAEVNGADVLSYYLDYYLLNPRFSEFD